jgi:hypothetical protein
MSSKAEGGRLYDLDSLDVVRWRNGKDHVREICEELVLAQAPENLLLAILDLHRNMRAAQAIAVNLFGTEWPDYVVDMYDRLKDLKDDFDNADEPKGKVEQVVNGGAA